MANLKDIRDRISSVKNTRKITEAMRLVAAAKVRRAQEQVLRSRPFADRLARVLENLQSHMGSGESESPLLQLRDVANITLVAVISAIAATKVFEEVYLMTQGGPADSTRTLVYYVYDQAFAELEISYACTIGLALFLIVLMLSLVRYLFAGDRGLT